MKTWDKNHPPPPLPLISCQKGRRRRQRRRRQRLHFLTYAMKTRLRRHVLGLTKGTAMSEGNQHPPCLPASFNIQPFLTFLMNVVKKASFVPLSSLLFFQIPIIIIIIMLQGMMVAFSQCHLIINKPTPSTTFFRCVCGFLRQNRGKHRRQLRDLAPHLAFCYLLYYYYYYYL